MAQLSKEDRLRNLHASALAEFDTVWDASRDQRLQALEDRRFYSIAGAQWEGALGEQFANKPRFEFNKVHLAVIRIINEYRNNRVTVDFTSRDGSDADELADTCDGLLRADETACSADEAYDNAFEEAASGGFGAWRLRACYEDDEDDENDAQRVMIEPIHDADTCVFFNLDARRQDKADARRCWVLTPYTHAKFEAEFGHSPVDWPKDQWDWAFEWMTPDIVWVCEFYEITERYELTHVFESLDGQEVKVTAAELKEDPELMSQLLATGHRLVREKRMERKQVRKYIMSGQGVEEDCGVIPGRCIPIIPVFGKRWVVDGVERMMGHVRLAKDAQRLTNMLMSWLAEMSARFDTEKPIFTPEQVARHAAMWAEDNVKKYPYLLADNQKDASGSPIPGSNAPVAYTRAPNIPPAMAALSQLAGVALTELLGNQEAGEQLQANISGKVMELIQTRIDMQAFIYLSNFAKAQKRSGEVWLSMKKELTVEESRRMKTVQRDGKTGSVVVNEPYYDQEQAREVVKNDLSRANLEVNVQVGPSSSSKRQAVVRQLLNLRQIEQDPQTAKALTLSIIANIEGEGLGDLNDWARMEGIRLGTIKPTDEEREQLAAEAQNQQPNAQEQYFRAAAERESADAALARAGTVDKIAGADLKKAQTAETWAKAMGEEQAQQIASIDTLRGLLQPQI
jgi:hypothetical protein